MISKLQKFTESVTLDVLGVVIVVSASIAMGYHLTVIDGIPIGISVHRGRGLLHDGHAFGHQAK